MGIYVLGTRPYDATPTREVVILHVCLDARARTTRERPVQSSHRKIEPLLRVAVIISQSYGQEIELCTPRDRPSTLNLSYWMICLAAS